MLNTSASICFNGPKAAAAPGLTAAGAAKASPSLDWARAEPVTANSAAASVMTPAPKRRRRGWLIGSGDSVVVISASPGASWQKRGEDTQHHWNVGCDLEGFDSDEVDRDVDVAARGVGVGTHLVGGLDQSPADLAPDTGQADIEAGGKPVGAVRRAEVHLGVDGDIGRQLHLHLAGRQFDRAQETGRPASGEQLLGVGAGAWTARRRQYDLQSAVAGAGAATVPAAGGVGPGRVEHFFELGHCRFLSENS